MANIFFTGVHNDMNNVCFKAKYVKPVTVKHYDGKGYRLKTLNLVELEQSDANSMQILKNNWRAAFADLITNDVKHLNTYKKECLGSVLAITEQDCLFELLDPQKVQALASMRFDPIKDVVTISHLQVNPSCISENYGTLKENCLRRIDKFLNPKFYRKEPKKYKNLGTALLTAIKEIIPNDVIEVVSLKKALRFYLKNEFKITNLKTLTLKWKRKA